MNVKPFSIDRIQHHPKIGYWFDCSMVSRCAPVFDDCYDNYDVEKRLRDAKVITKVMQTDTESCAVVINFNGKRQAEDFINRLNKFLEKN